MDEGVQKSKEWAVTAWREFDAPPNGGGHQTMVDDVQCGHLIVPFAHHKEYCVKELCEFGEVIPPASLSHLKNPKRRFRIKCFVYYFTRICVRCLPAGQWAIDWNRQVGNGDCNRQTNRPHMPPRTTTYWTGLAGNCRQSARLAVERVFCLPSDGVPAPTWSEKQQRTFINVYMLFT